MKTRILNKWKNLRNASLEQRANVLAYNIWQLALASAIKLHKERYEYNDDESRISVIREYMMFLIHVTDRLTYERFNETQRHRFVSHLSNDTSSQLQRNQEQSIGRGDYKSAYIEELNKRLGQYASTSFINNEPGYSMLRTFAYHIVYCMQSNQTNKWVIDQIMEIDAPLAAEKTRTSVVSIMQDWNV